MPYCLEKKTPSVSSEHERSETKLSGCEGRKKGFRRWDQKRGIIQRLGCTSQARRRDRRGRRRRDWATGKIKLRSVPQRSRGGTTAGERLKTKKFRHGGKQCVTLSTEGQTTNTSISQPGVRKSQGRANPKYVASRIGKITTMNAKSGGRGDKKGRERLRRPRGGGSSQERTKDRARDVRAIFGLVRVQGKKRRNQAIATAFAREGLIPSSPENVGRKESIKNPKLGGDKKIMLPEHREGQGGLKKELADRQNKGKKHLKLQTKCVVSMMDITAMQPRGGNPI